MRFDEFVRRKNRITHRIQLLRWTVRNNVIMIIHNNIPKAIETLHEGHPATRLLNKLEKRVAHVFAALDRLQRVQRGTVDNLRLLQQRNLYDRSNALPPPLTFISLASPQTRFPTRIVVSSFNPRSTTRLVISPSQAPSPNVRDWRAGRFASTVSFVT